MELKAISQFSSENHEFAQHPLCAESLEMTIDFFARVGFEPPWIGYYAQLGRDFVGAAGFKGRPVDGKVEIAYATFEPFKHQGIGTEICRALVAISLEADPSIKITARTLPESEFSIKILQKNGFRFIGTVQDPEDGEVLEWAYQQ